MKKLLLSFATVILATTSVAWADVVVTPQIGYQFQTSDTKNRQTYSTDSNEFQKNHALTGIQVGYDLNKQTQVGVEYQRADSNLKSETAGLFVNQDLHHNLYGVLGGGYYHLSNIESPYVTLGIGYKHPLTNMISAKVEVRDQYVTNENMWVPQALVGFEFKINEITKAYR